MKAPDDKWEWTPPSPMLDRQHVYLIMGLLGAIAVFIAFIG
jgi:hypothetical protein